MPVPVREPILGQPVGQTSKTFRGEVLATVVAFLAWLNTVLT